MANPDPEILPELALAVRPDAIIGTGRSDYPNQVNNVLCFPFMFRGALDCGATTINEAMKLAAVRAIAELAHAEIPDVVARAYGASGLRFGRDYLIPKPFDPRLIEFVAPAVAQAAADSGVAQRPIGDMERIAIACVTSSIRRRRHAAGVRGCQAGCAERLRRVAYAEGDNERVLRAAQIVVDEKLARPVLLGRAKQISARIAEFGLRLTPGVDCDIVDSHDPAMLGKFADDYRRSVGTSISNEYARSRCASTAHCSDPCSSRRARSMRCCAAPRGAMTATSTRSAM